MSSYDFPIGSYKVELSKDGSEESIWVHHKHTVEVVKLKWRIYIGKYALVPDGIYRRDACFKYVLVEQDFYEYMRKKLICDECTKPDLSYCEIDYLARAAISIISCLMNESNNYSDHMYDALLDLGDDIIKDNHLYEVILENIRRANEIGDSYALCE